MKSYDTKSVLIHVYDGTINPPSKIIYRQSHYSKFVKSAPQQVDVIVSKLSDDIISGILLAVIFTLIILLAFSFT